MTQRSRTNLGYFCFALFSAVTMPFDAIGHEDHPSIPTTASAPVDYYQGFMMLIGAGYGVYLLIRAQKRRRGRRIMDQ